RRLAALWDDLTLDTPSFWPPEASRDLSLFGLPGFYAPRSDILAFAAWTSLYDTSPLLTTLRQHVDFAALNGSATAFTVTAVDAVTGELQHFRNHDQGTDKKVTVEPRHVLASGSL